VNEKLSTTVARQAIPRHMNLRVLLISMAVIGFIAVIATFKW